MRKTQKALSEVDLGDKDSFCPGDLVRHAVFEECVGIIISCYTKSHRPLSDEYEVFWNQGPLKDDKNPTVESGTSLILLSRKI